MALSCQCHEEYKGTKTTPDCPFYGLTTLNWPRFFPSPNLFPINLAYIEIWSVHTELTRYRTQKESRSVQCGQAVNVICNSFGHKILHIFDCFHKFVTITKGHDCRWRSQIFAKSLQRTGKVVIFHCFISNNINLSCKKFWWNICLVLRIQSSGLWMSWGHKRQRVFSCFSVVYW